MDAATVRSRLRAEGISVTVHQDGRLTAALMKPREESWAGWLMARVRAIPGATPIHRRLRPAADPYFEHNEVVFRLGPPPETASAQSVNAKAFTTEVPHEVARGGRAEAPPAHLCASQGSRPGSLEGPGRVSPGNVVGRAEQGRAA